MSETYAIVARHYSETRREPRYDETFEQFLERLIRAADHGFHHVVEVHRDGEKVLDNRDTHPMSDDYTRTETLLSGDDDDG